MLNFTNSKSRLCLKTSQEARMRLLGCQLKLAHMFSSILMNLLCYYIFISSVIALHIFWGCSLSDASCVLGSAPLSFLRNMHGSPFLGATNFLNYSWEMNSCSISATAWFMQYFYCFLLEDWNTWNSIVFNSSDPIKVDWAWGTEFTEILLDL